MVLQLELLLADLRGDQLVLRGDRDVLPGRHGERPGGQARQAGQHHGVRRRAATADPGDQRDVGDQPVHGAEYSGPQPAAGDIAVLVPVCLARRVPSNGHWWVPQMSMSGPVCRGRQPVPMRRWNASRNEPLVYHYSLVAVAAGIRSLVSPATGPAVCGRPAAFQAWKPPSRSVASRRPIRRSDRRGERRRVALRAHHDDARVGAGQSRDPGLAARVQPPLEHVTADDDRPWDLALDDPLLQRPDVDKYRAVGEGSERRLGPEPPAGRCGPRPPVRRCPGRRPGSASEVSSAADAVASASAVSAPPRPRAPSGPSMATVSLAISP